MTYLRPRTLDDILEMKERGDSEGATLEYKSSRLFEQKNDKVFETLSKEVTALANAIGGILIIGLEEDNDRRIANIVPVQDPLRSETWLEDGLLSRITPSLQLSIERIEVESGHGVSAANPAFEVSNIAIVDGVTLKPGENDHETLRWN